VTTPPVVTFASAPDQSEDTLSIKEVAASLDRTIGRISNWIKSGRLQARIDGTQYNAPRLIAISEMERVAKILAISKADLRSARPSSTG
jgi:transposase